MIKAVAQAQRGGGQGLADSIARGDIKRAMHNGRELYFMPQVRIGDVVEVGTESASNKTKATTDNAHEALLQMVDSFGWSITPETTATEVAEATAMLTLPKEVMTKLEATCLDLNRATKAAEQLHMKKTELVGLSAFAMTQLSQLAEQIIIVTQVASDISCMMKFRKAPKGVALTLNVIRDLQASAAKNLTQLQEFWRAAKSIQV